VRIIKEKGCSEKERMEDYLSGLYVVLVDFIAFNATGRCVTASGYEEAC
jgi:hypothetical protein